MNKSIFGFGVFSPKGFLGKGGVFSRKERMANGRKERVWVVFMFWTPAYALQFFLRRKLDPGLLFVMIRMKNEYVQEFFVSLFES